MSAWQKGQPKIASMSHGRAQPRHRRRKSDFFGSPAKQSIDAPPAAAPEAAAPEAADDDWVRCHDAATGASYYANRRSFEVSWTPPPSRMPPPAPASAPAPPPPVVAAAESVAAPPPARARRAADAAWIGRGTAALAKAAREVRAPVVAPVSEPPSPPTPEPVPEPPPPLVPEAPPTPEPAESLYEEEFVVVDERTDSGTEGSGASYEEFEEIEEVVVADDALDRLPDAAPRPPPVAAPIEPGPAPGSAPPTTLGSVEGDGDAAMADTPAAVPPEPAPAPTAPPARRKTAQELLAALAEVSERLAEPLARWQGISAAARPRAPLDARGAPTRRGRALLAAARRCQAPA